MHKPNVAQEAFLDAVVAALYVSLVAVLLNNAERIFGKMNGVLPGVAFLLLFVFSAAVMGVTIFGRPILWYLEGKKKEAVGLVVATLAYLLGLLVIVLATLMLRAS